MALSWVLPSTNYVLQQGSDLRGWVNVTNTPVLNLGKLQNEVMIPVTSGSGFFRLVTP
jgi:hypothetical protein